MEVVPDGVPVVRKPSDSKEGNIASAKCDDGTGKELTRKRKASDAKHLSGSKEHKSKKLRGEKDKIETKTKSVKSGADSKIKKKDADGGAKNKERKKDAEKSDNKDNNKDKEKKKDREKTTAKDPDKNDGKIIAKDHKDKKLSSHPKDNKQDDGSKEKRNVINEEKGTEGDDPSKENDNECKNTDKSSDAVDVENKVDNSNSKKAHKANDSSRKLIKKTKSKSSKVSSKLAKEKKDKESKQSEQKNDEDNGDKMDVVPSADTELISDEEVNYEEITSEKVAIPPEQCEQLGLGVLEPILSTSSDDEDIEQITVDVENLKDYLEDATPLFNPFTYEIKPLSSYRSPCMTEYEWSCSQSEKKFNTTDCSDEEYDKYTNIICKDYNIMFTGNEEIWLQDVESVIPILQKCLIRSPRKRDDIDRIISWVNIGLDYNMINDQPKPACRIRHIKVGLVLTDILCQCGPNIMLDLIERVDVHRKLLALFDVDNMALSIKLLILRTLDSTLQYGPSVREFLTDDANNQNGYRTLIKMLRTTSRRIRIRYAITNILRKIHLFEMLEVVRDIVDERWKCSQLTTETIDKLEICLEEIVKYVRNASTLISQPIRFLPARFQFEYAALCHPDPYRALYNYFDYFQLGDILFTLLSVRRSINKETASSSSIIPSVLEIIGEFLNTSDGLLFLCSKAQVCNQIVPILFECISKNRSISSADDDGNNSTDCVDYIPSELLGVHMVHYVYVLNLMDRLRALIDDCSSKSISNKTTAAIVDSYEILETLHSLRCLTLTPLGRSSVAHVLARTNIIEPLFVLLRMGDYLGGKNRKSPTKGYVADLVLIVLNYSDHVPFLQRYAKRLNEYAEMKELSKVKNWLYPIKNVEANVFSYRDNISQLCEHLKSNIEISYAFPEELITTVRLLSHLAVPPPSAITSEEITEIKYRYVLIQLYSYDGLTMLLSILKNVCDHYDNPYLYSCLFAGNIGESILSLIVPVLRLIRSLLTHLIRCQNGDLKNFTPIPILLRTYALLYAVPASSSSSSDTVQLKIPYANKDIVRSLLAYTRSSVVDLTTTTAANSTNTNTSSSATASDSRLPADNLWSSMIRNVLCFIADNPNFSAAGLSVLSEMLPLPLPVRTKSPPTKSQISSLLTCRKLWSVHLLPCESELQELIKRLCVSSDRSLCHLLRKVCIQLADLSSYTACLVVRSILSVLLLARPATAAAAVETTTDDFIFLRAPLTLLENLSNVPVIKTALIQSTTESFSSDLLVLLWKAFGDLLRTDSTSTYHQCQQQSVLNIIRDLCDSDIYLYSPLSTTSPPGETTVVSQLFYAHLSNSLPPKDTLCSIYQSIMDHLCRTNDESPPVRLTTVLSSLRILILLAKHDYGYFHFKTTTVDRYPDLFFNLLNSLVNGWQSENPLYVTVTASVIQLLREYLCCFDEEHKSLIPRRSLSPLTVEELAVLVKWPPRNPNGKERENVVVVVEEEEIINKEVEKKEIQDGETTTDRHPLIRLNALLANESKCNNEDLNALYENAKEIANKLSQVDEISKSIDVFQTQQSSLPEPILPASESLMFQFSSRRVFVIEDCCMTTDKLTADDYWFGRTTTTGTPVDDTTEKVPTDLTEITNFLSSFNIEHDLKQLISRCVEGGCKSAQLVCPAEKKCDQKQPPSSVIVTQSVTSVNKPATNQRGVDPFRSRVPNSSRAPSMHVDEFIALESKTENPAFALRRNPQEMLFQNHLQGPRSRPFEPNHFHMQFRARVPGWYPPVMGEMHHPPVMGEMHHPSVMGEMHHPSVMGEMRHPSVMGEMRHPSVMGEMRHPSVMGEMRHPPPGRPQLVMRNSNEYIRFNLGLRWAPPRPMPPLHRHVRPFQPL